MQHRTQWATEVIHRGKSGRVMGLTTHLNIAPRLRVSGAIRSLPTYAFVVRSGQV